MPKCMYCGEEANENHVCDSCEAEAEKLDKKDGQEKEGFDYKAWYEENKETVSKKRKERYKKDEDYRNKKKLEATRYYWLKQRRAKSVGMNQLEYEELEIEPKGTQEVTIQNEKDIRYGMTLEVPIFYPRDVANVLRRSTQTLRLWMLNGYIEDVFMRDNRNYRVFSEDQMRVFVENRHWLSFNVQDFQLHPFFSLVNEEMARLMPDGVEPMLEEDWREDPTHCPFCGSTPSLQRRVDSSWEYVSCFNCKDPVDVHGRETMKRYVVSGECPYCDNMIEDEVEAVEGRKLNVVCPRCGRRVTDYRKVEIERR